MDSQTTRLGLRRTRWLLAVVLAVFTGLAYTSPALATTVDIQGSSLLVDDGGAGTATAAAKPPKTPPGQAKEVNLISVRFDTVPGNYAVTDTAADITTTDPACADLGKTVTCPSAGITAISVTSGKGNDSITVGSTPAPTVTLNGEDGDDTLTGASDAAGENLIGDKGNDRMFGGAGPDIFAGGAGFDTVSYADHTAGVVVTIGSLGNDGNASDAPGDSVDGTNEKVVGSPGDDFVKGNGGANVLAGKSGNDRLKGKKGPDKLKGGLDIDVLLAKDGTEDRKIKCGPGANSLERARWDRGLDPRPRSC